MTTHPTVGRVALVTQLCILAPALAHAQDGSRQVAGPAWEEPQTQARPVPWLMPNAQLQMWFTAFDQDENPQADPGGYGDPEADVGFSIPRARLGFTGGFKWVDFGLRFGTSRPYDAVSPDPAPVDLIDGWARMRFDTIAGTTSLTFGQHNIPFSREMQMSSNDLVFQERAVSTNWLAPLRDLGATLRHDWRYIGAAVGVYNGGGDLFGDVDPGVQVAARLDLHIGGDTYRTNSTTNAFGIGGGYVYNKTFATTEQRVAVDLLGRIVGLTLFVEGEMNFIDPDEDPTIVVPGVFAPTTRWGGLAQLSWYGDLPIGAIEPAVRFSYFDDNREISDNGDVGILHAGLQWREPVPFMDFGAAYIHRFEFGGREIENNSVRITVGLKYPSRKFAPVDLLSVLRDLGSKPLAAPDDVPAGKKGRKKKD